MGALATAHSVGALSIGIANNALAPLATQADIGITLDTGAELISGSTRLKAGTSQKIALNTFSSAVMVRLHKVYGNLMVDLKPTNAKLLRRAIALTALVSGAGDELAGQTLKDCGFEVKVAIVALKNKVSAAQARELLASASDNLRLAIREP